MTQPFGQVVLAATDIFLHTRLSVAFVNLKPIAPGHVLVAPRRVVARFAELSADEVGDLYRAVQRVGGVVERVFGGEALSIVLQDGPAAGQTIRHVHVHVIPRRLGDWANNDDVYPAIDRASREAAQGVDADAQRKPRSRDEMAAEAAVLRAHFADGADE